MRLQSLGLSSWRSRVWTVTGQCWQFSSPQKKAWLWLLRVGLKTSPLSTLRLEPAADLSSPLRWLIRFCCHKERDCVQRVSTEGEAVESDRLVGIAACCSPAAGPGQAPSPVCKMGLWHACLM